MATIKDVARLAGVGLGTASRVVTSKGSFSADAADRVQAAVKQLGFRPSNIARALSSQRSGTIGVYVPDFKGPFYGPMLHAIDQELRLHGRHMVAANGCGHEDVRQQALDGVQLLIDRECDGMILTTNALRDADFAQIRQRFPNLAVVNREVRGMKALCFSVDHRLAGQLAAQALVSNGHKRIAVISGPQEAGDNRQRLQGFFEVLEKRGITREQVTLIEANFAASGGWEAASRLLGRGTRFTGLFCANDQMAMGAMSRLHAAGVAVPGDVSVVGYDDAEVATYLAPRLTSVHIAIDDMGLNACRLLLNQCYQSELAVSHAFQPTLVMRESVAKVGR
ncbi:MAG TPA: LacI family DNA-binding transcriptional regulator [Rhizobacter sp.]|jgi:LacI family transcriptional regulator|nr:LacI family DNA-binding transcriptional regulator [Rhizobacter sp.]